jgi:hypothetical protein
MDEELSHPASAAVGIVRRVEPVASAHERPIDDMIEFGGGIVEFRERRCGIAVGEHARQPGLVGGFS